MRVLEFFSGIGGWRCALLKQLQQQQLQAAAAAAAAPQTQTQLKQDQDQDQEENQDQEERVHQKGEEGSEGVLCFEVAQAFDINTASNQVYQHNFSEHPSASPSPSSSPSAKCINSLTRKMLDKHCADMWCMSPPCQPYTRNNNSCKRDTADQRANALLHLLLLLREVLHRPRYILLENVVGFETSDCCEKLLETLAETGYTHVEFILTPTQFGIPNSRPRYYLLAYLKPADKECPLSSPLWNDVARSGPGMKEEWCGDRSAILKEIPHFQSADIIRPLSQWLEPPDFDDTSLLISKEVLEKPSSWCFDIVTPADTYTACFTKAYSRYAKGTGSVLSTAGWAASAKCPVVDVICEGDNNPVKRPRTEGHHTTEIISAKSPQKSETVPENGEKGEGKKFLTAEQIATLRLRYFSPRELLRLFGFPVQCEGNVQKEEEVKDETSSGFGFPVDFPRKKAYELIGNSLNVEVAAHLIHFLLSNTGESQKGSYKSPQREPEVSIR